MKKIIIVALAALAIMSCTKVINIDVNPSDAKIVIEANITNEAGPYFVLLTKTLNLSDSSNYLTVSGAKVAITDKTTTQTDNLLEIQSGVYMTTSIQGIVGHTYDLLVSSEGKSYTASSTMPMPVRLDSISFTQQSNVNETNINTNIYFQDPAGVPNYYTFNRFINGRKRGRTNVFEDRLSDGKYITEEQRGSAVKLGDTVRVQMNCVDRYAWDYFNSLQGGGFASSPTPANPTSNISNGALGYFSAHSVQTKVGVAK
jgi:Domain of unknown function (DUF4249)